MTVSFMYIMYIEVYFLCQGWDSINPILKPPGAKFFGLLILEVADGTGSLLAFFEHWPMSFQSLCDAHSEPP